MAVELFVNFQRSRSHIDYFLRHRIFNDFSVLDSVTESASHRYWFLSIMDTSIFKRQHTVFICVHNSTKSISFESILQETCICT